MKVIISGLTASGKSTLAKQLSQALGIEYFTASTKWKDILPKKDFLFWESQRGLDAIKFRLSNLKYDRQLDRYILSHVKKRDDLILDSWVASWKINEKDMIKIYQKADLHTRARRVSFRAGMPQREAIKFMKEKDRYMHILYLKLHKIDVVNDLTPFDLVINSARLSKEGLRDVCLDFIKNFKKETQVY